MNEDQDRLFDSFLEERYESRTELPDDEGDWYRIDEDEGDEGAEDEK